LDFKTLPIVVVLPSAVFFPVKPFHEVVARICSTLMFDYCMQAIPQTNRAMVLRHERNLQYPVGWKLYLVLSLDSPRRRVELVVLHAVNFHHHCGRWVGRDIAHTALQY
jgi:hypothetical protein